MKRFNDQSIRTKLTVLLMGITTAAVLAATLIFFTLVNDQYRQVYQANLQNLTDVLATNCQNALSGRNQKEAEQLLLSLKSRPSVVAATITDTEGRLFASYGKAATGQEIATVSHPIELNGAKIGAITLQDDMHSILAFRYFAILTLVLIVLLVSGLSFFLAARLTEVISRPITELSKIAEEISKNQDYQLRAKKYGSDEVGNLVDSFNGMLAQIDVRNQALRISEKRYRALLNQAADAFFLYNSKGKIVDVNQRACDSLGFSREELLSMNIANIEMPSDNQHVGGKYWQKLWPERPLTIEGVHHRKDGVTFPVEVRIGLLWLAGERLVISLARDISERLDSEKERRQLEGQLLQSQKMESIGTLAGGIAHDFNNILTPIYGYLELAMLKLPADQPVREHLEKVYQAAGRARELVNQILTFSRRDSVQQTPVEVQVIVKEALKLLRASIPATIEIRQEIDPNCPPVMANPTQIHQILINLCTNAYHAMRETGGTLRVSLAPVEISAQDYLKELDLRPGQFLRLEVNDTGCGMTRETLDRALEPYFTTKPKDEGTGMGLAVVHGIVKGYGGGISLTSEPGQGTTIRIYLPASARPTARKAQPHQITLPTGKERIMLVDDERAVVDAEKALIESLGYQVTAFTNPLEALAAFTATPGQFDLLVTDMTMPKMTGDRFAEKVMEIRPGLPIIVCTGYSDVLNRESTHALGIREVVTKPLGRQDFAHTIRKVLDGRTSG